MRKYIFEAALALGLAVSLIIGALACNTQNDISKKLIRLHIIANSDSKADQRLKLEVRDEILNYVSKITENCQNINEARIVVSKNLKSLEKIAVSIIEKNGFSYEAHAELGKVYFPTRSYDSFSLPAGDYEALRLKLGAAEGKNWWCVLFPPVCVSAAMTECEFKNAGMTEKEINFVMSDDTEYHLKFKIIEIIREISHRI